MMTAVSVCPSCDAGCVPDLLHCWNCGRALDAAVETRVEYAGFLRRLMAYGIDAAICLVGMGLAALPITLLLGLPSVSGLPTDPSKGLYFMRIFMAIGILSKIGAWLYYTLAESSSWEGTPGKMAVGIRVTDPNGNRISFIQANKRYWGKLASAILYLGYLSIFFTEKRQALHDFIANTVVSRR